MRAPLTAVSSVICALLAASGTVFANTSLAVLPGMTAAVTTPASPPFLSLEDTRLELRLHAWSAPAANANIFTNAGFTIQLRNSGELCASDNIDALPNYGGTMCADITGRKDVTLRVQRDTGNKLLRYEVRDSAGSWAGIAYCGTKQNGTTYLNTFPCPISTVRSNSWAGTGRIGDGVANVRIAWIKWHSSVVPPGSGGLGENASADLADWRFEGGMANQGTGGYTAAIGPLEAQTLAPNAGVAGVAFMPSPVLAPVCFAGAQQTFRAGYPAQLDGSGSYPMDGGAGLTYAWTQVSGPSMATWAGKSTARPAVSGLIFGSYVFGLTVTDGGGVSSACTVKHGAVASDDNGVVITSSVAADTLLGPLVRFGANPWPWFDDRHRAEADQQIGNLDTYYGAYWDPASPAYGSDTARGAWLYNSAPANYYDNVAAYYALYYRSGLDDYLLAARKLADRFWVSPMVNSGTTCNAWVGMGSCYPARSLSVLGLVLRAADGRADMWPGLHTIFESYRSYYLEVADPAWGMWDIREMAYHLAVVSYAAMFDPDPAYRQTAKTSISKALAKTWAPARGADGSFPMLYQKATSWDSGTAAALANGSRNVIGVGTKWDADTFRCGNAAGRVYSCDVWFTNQSAVKPSGNADGDAATYTATVVDGTHLTLDRPYEGSTGTHGWALPDPNAGLVGFGAQPFIQGILGTAFQFAGQAIADSDPQGSALAFSYTAGIANWIRTQGFWNATRGMYYGVGFPNCRFPISDSNVFCTGGNSTGEARVLNAESMRVVMTAYAHTGDVALRAFGDTLYSAMFSKPGAGGPDTDGSYVEALDDGTGWYMIGVPPTGKAPKYFGMFFGFGALSGWPAYRAGAQVTQSAAAVTVNVGALRGATHARITITAPNGGRTETQCGLGRCAVYLDARQGGHLATVEYLSANGSVVARVERTLDPRQ